MSINKDLIFTSQTLTKLRNWVLLIQLFFSTLAYTMKAVNSNQFALSFGIITIAFILNQISDKLNNFFSSKRFSVFFDFTVLCFLLFVNGGNKNPFIMIILLHYFIVPFFLTLKQNIFFHFIAIGYLYSLHHSPFGFKIKNTQILSENLNTFSILVVGVAIWTVSYWIFLELTKLHRRLTNFATSSGQIDKYRALGFLTAGVCHELGTPLNTLKLSFDEIDDAVSKDEKELINRNIDRCIRALRDLNNHVHDADSHFYEEKISLEEVIKEVVKNYQETSNIVILFNSEALKPPLIRIPKLIFVRSLLDIFDNASQAQATHIEVELIVNERLELKITDNGIGFPQTHLSLLGTPFFTTKDSGTGLGLYHLKNLINLAGGEILFKNNNGASILISFPNDLEYNKEGI